MSSSSNLTAKYDTERARLHDQSQLIYLQGQIDELRRLMKDQTNKYQWALEQIRKTESVVSQIQGLFDTHREEIARLVERSRRDIADLRKEVATAMVTIEESVKPIRDMQAQIHQLAEARKQDREDVFPWFSRIEDTEEKYQTLFNQIRESEERYRQLEMQLDRLREADTVALQEVRRVSESIHTEKQSIRRQIVETQQIITATEEATREMVSRIDRVEDLHEQLQLFSEGVPDQITELAGRFETVELDIKRIEVAASDWFMLTQERTEELRQQTNERVSELYEVDERHLKQLTAWLERLDGWIRELEIRLGQGVNELESTHRHHYERVRELERRELQMLNRVLEAIQTHQALVESEQVKLHQAD